MQRKTKVFDSLSFEEIQAMSFFSFYRMVKELDGETVSGHNRSRSGARSLATHKSTVKFFKREYNRRARRALKRGAILTNAEFNKLRDISWVLD